MVLNIIDVIEGEGSQRSGLLCWFLRVMFVFFFVIDYVKVFFIFFKGLIDYWIFLGYRGDDKERKLE